MATTTTTTLMDKKTMNFAVRLPTEVVMKLDQLKGKYSSRNQLMRRIVDEYLETQGERLNN
jgi:metal-responsive CopG/Arc/MetJ family transcriptional regulator